ncbi:hypothetical protein [Arcicella lustrica]|uniref:Outer membrane protein beta-barrel domain-containing protein n=1 Tax=Arcicella lustrica TaxID=2984196 RepID=A0ABU5SLV7_9BACT|nr:hypothetical protein [Arcicella sp. DC25W]MEA5428243.1 hypothetical protein [Arcicella sp. DC25W]
MKNRLTILFCFLFSASFAQEKTSKIERFFQNKYVNYTEFGGLFGKSYQISQQAYATPVDGRTNFTIQSYNGYKIFDKLSAGVTVGVDWFNAMQIVPVSVGIRNTYGKANTKKVKPYIGIDAGYGFTWLNDDASDNQTASGGLALSPVLGLLIPTGGQANFVLSVGYKHNAFKTVTTSGTSEYPYTTTKEYELNRMAVRLGVNF